MIPGNWRASAHIIAALMLGPLLSGNASAEQPEYTVSSRDGTITLPWRSAYHQYHTLTVNNARGDSVVRYPVVKEQGWVISGLSDGRYQVLLEGAGKPSSIATLQISHYPLQSALGLFVLGFIMFTYLLFTLYRGNKCVDHD